MTQSKSRPTGEAGGSSKAGGPANSLGDGSDIGRETLLGNSKLRTELESHGLPLGRLTVLAPQNDPFRLDTRAGHRDGAWLAEQIADLGIEGTLHLRGLHYALVSRTRPDGSQYVNDDAAWTWLSAGAAKAARWLGYVPWERIHDGRNAAPIININAAADPFPVIDVGVQIRIPEAWELDPVVVPLGFTGRQPHRMVMIGEKSSLQPVLGPLGREYGADLYLPTGEPSDTMLHDIAARAAADGRPLVLLYFSDCDPSGWQMPISVARKLQAFRTALFPNLAFQVRRVALVPDQVREYGLPSTPLKDTERRADRWSREMGVQQTEIDALAALRPDLLRQIARKALDQFTDQTLPERVAHARDRWTVRAQRALEAAVGPEYLDQIRAQAAAKLETAAALIDQINAAMRIDVEGIDLPPIEVPQAVVPDEPGDLPVIDSRRPFTEQCARLIAAKDYTGGTANGAEQ